MAVKLYQEPQLQDVLMFCGWPGIGNIGINAMDTLRGILQAKEFGQIEPEEFFNPRRVHIEDGLLKGMEFGRNKFYGQRVKGQDVIFFIGDEQPTEGKARYAEGQKAYQMANLVLDVAEKFGCRRLYTSGAAVSQIHHTARPRVWAVPNDDSLISEIKQYDNTILMSGVEGRGGQGQISGLNGLMLGAAKKRGVAAVCLMGEIPYYLQGAPWPYPKGSKSVLEVLLRILDITVDLSQLDEVGEKVEKNINDFLEKLSRIEELPAQVREEIGKLRYAKPIMPGPITEEEQREMMKHLDELFNQKEGKDERQL